MYTRDRLIHALRRHGIEDERVLAALGRVPREEFVDEQLRDQAYHNQPLPIGYQQTISQPYIVALMSETLRTHPGNRVLEIGTGSGYQTAVLAELRCVVYSVEIIPQLAARAGELLMRLGYEDVHQRVGDGHEGWTEHAPFDAIIVTAAPPRTPARLLDQLRSPGRMVVPLGDQRDHQILTLMQKSEDRLSVRSVAPVRFVPLITPP